MNALLTIGSLALASAVTSKSESSDVEFNNKGLKSIHFDEHTKGILVSDSLFNFNFNETVSSVFETSRNSSIPLLPLGTLNGDLVFSESANISKVIDGYVTINNSTEHFYACKSSSWDPFHYTANSNSFGISIHESDPPANCHSVKIRVD